RRRMSSRCSRTRDSPRSTSAAWRPEGGCSRSTIRSPASTSSNSELGSKIRALSPENTLWWEEEDSNLRRLSRRFYRPLPLAARASSRWRKDSNRRFDTSTIGWPEMAKQDFSFDIVSEVSMPEVANAVDQARREIAQRFDFKDTGTSISQDDQLIEARSSTEAGLRAAVGVLKEKAVRRRVWLKALPSGRTHRAARGASRQS